jgi:Ca-activated chloride channel family protein
MHNIKSEIRAWLWVLALMLVLQALPEPLLAEEMAPSQAQAGSLLWKMAQGYSTATTINTDVDMKISGLVARVSIRQEFRNEGSEWVEGIYVFPLPDRAAVDQMRPLHRGRDT